MPRILVTYDLPSRRYTEVEDAIKAFGDWAKVANTAFVVITYATPVAVRDAVQAAGGPGARVFACECGHAWASGGQPPDVDQWLVRNWP